MEQSINYQTMIKKLKKGWKIVLFTTLITTVVGCLINYFWIYPVYEAKADILINGTVVKDSGKEISLSEVEINIRLIETYSIMIKSDRILDKVVKNMGGTIGKEELMEQTKILTNENSQIISIIVENFDSNKAAKIANVLAVTFREEVKQVMDVDNVHILSKASPSKEPVRPNKVMNIILSMFIGLILSVTWIFYWKLKM